MKIKLKMEFIFNEVSKKDFDQVKHVLTTNYEETVKDIEKDFNKEFSTMNVTGKINEIEVIDD